MRAVGTSDWCVCLAGVVGALGRGIVGRMEARQRGEPQMGSRAMVARLAWVQSWSASSLGRDVERLGPGGQRRADGRHGAVRGSLHVLVVVMGVVRGGVGSEDDSRKRGRCWRRSHMMGWREELVWPY